MPLPSFKDVLLRDSKHKKLVDVSKMPDKRGLLLSKSEHHSTCNSKLNRGSKGEQSASNSYEGLDWKTLNWGIWSLKPITLNVTPGDKVILEDILLDKDGKVKHASFVKVVHILYIYIYI